VSFIVVASLCGDRYGPFYFLTRVIGVDTLSPSQYREGDCVTEDASGKRYENGKLCVTNDCIDNAISYYSTSPVSQVSNGLVNIALTPTQTLGIPYILPGCLVLIGLIGVAASFCGKSCPRFSACCVASITLVTLPVLFVLVGGGLFPALIVTSDLCSTGANVGHVFVANSPKTICRAVSMEYTLPNSGGAWCCDELLRGIWSIVLVAVGSCSPLQPVLSDVVE
jgi:hypothetical protein